MILSNRATLKQPKPTVQIGVLVVTLWCLVLGTLPGFQGPYWCRRGRLQLQHKLRPSVTQHPAHSCHTLHLRLEACTAHKRKIAFQCAAAVAAGLSVHRCQQTCVFVCLCASHLHLQGCW
jgi:hypothetical protein